MNKTGNGRITPKLTLKINTMGNGITTWDLEVPISSKSVEKMTKNRIFLYFHSLNIYKPNCKYKWLTVKGRTIPKLALITNVIGILIKIWHLWRPISGKNSGKKSDKKNDINFDLSNIEKSEFHSLEKCFSSKFQKDSSTRCYLFFKKYMRSTMLMFTMFHFQIRLIRNQLYLREDHLHRLLHQGVNSFASKDHHLDYNQKYQVHNCSLLNGGHHSKTNRRHSHC